MLIECPACHVRSKLSADKEGAKVRCGECGRIYLARDVTGRGGPVRGGGDATRGIALAVGGVVVAAILIFAFTRSEKEPEPVLAAAPEPAVPAAPVDDLDERGWKSGLVQVAVQVHEAAAAARAARIEERIDEAGMYAWRREQALAAGEEWEGPERFEDLAPGDKLKWHERLATDLIDADFAALVRDWEPYDGQVIGEPQDDRATVRLDTTVRDKSSAEKRTVEWRLARVDGRWKVASFERWYSEVELAAIARAEREANKGYEKVELSSGAIVYEREPEALVHLPDTPPELVARIDSLYATMIDLDQIQAGPAAQKDLVAIGKPAIPRLLTGLYEIPLETHEQSIQLNLIAHALRDITGKDFGFRPLVHEGSTFGTSDELRQSAIKQWFAWWYKEGAKFEALEKEDALEKLIREEEGDA